MRKSIASLLLIVAFILLQSKFVFSQQQLLLKPVQISLQDTSIDAVFDALSKQCQCYFSYNTHLVDGYKNVSLQVNNIPLLQALDTLFHGRFAFEEFRNQIIVFDKGTEKPKAFQANETYINISGIITDSISGLPIPFASIALVGEYLGTVSNENGEFNIKIPGNIDAKNVSISSMGYMNYTFRAKSDIVEIKLKPAVISIQEVLVHSIGPLVLLRKARKKFDENYQNKSYSFSSFYRESTRKGDDYLSYTEAYMHGKKFGIYSGRTDKMSLVKSRSFKNSSATDTILVKLQGGIDACIRLDLIRNQPDFLTEEGESLYDYQLRDVRIWEDRLVNVLTFVPKKGIVDAVFEGELYVGVEDYAIVGAEFGYSPHMMGVVKKSLVMRKSNKIKAKPISTNYNLKYSNYEGLYYIQHIRGELNLKAKNRKQVRFSNFYTTLEMVTTSIDTLNMNTPERKDFIKTHSIFSDQVKVSPTDFWEHDNVILPEANIMNAFQQSGFVLEEKK